MEFSKQDIILESWKTLKQHLGLWIMIMLFIFAVSLAISTVQEKLFDDITAQTILFSVSAYLFQAGINLGMLKIAINIQNNNEAEFKHVFGSFHMLVAYILATFIFLIILLFVASPGLILLTISASTTLESLSHLRGINNVSFIIPLLLIIIPVVYMSVRLQFYDYFLIDEECSILDSIKRSIYATKGYAGDLFILGAILSIIILISMIPLMLGLLVSMPLAIIVNTSVYLMLKKARYR